MDNRILQEKEQKLCNNKVTLISIIYGAFK